MTEHRTIELRHSRAESQRPDIIASIDKVRDVL